MSDFEHQRHKPPTPLERPRELALVCAPLRSSVNLSRIVRVASCCGITRLIACGQTKVDPKITRVVPDAFRLERHRTLPPVLKKLRQEGYRLVGLEQTTNSHNLHEYAFSRKTALVIGNERLGLEDDALTLLDDVVEIAVYGMPYSYNAAAATTMALYEYCRQFPTG
ncbi:MAG: RNA methyltransferase [Planctomycetaceae bacterium]|nr:RNA methyltransferase [Planctomycetaceae bacterium]